MLEATLGKENRRSCRYDTVQASAYLGWWSEPEFRSVAGELENLSRGGALVVVAETPPDGASVWFAVSAGPRAVGAGEADSAAKKPARGEKAAASGFSDRGV